MDKGQRVDTGLRGGGSVLGRAHRFLLSYTLGAIFFFFLVTLMFNYLNSLWGFLSSHHNLYERARQTRFLIFHLFISFYFTAISGSTDIMDLCTFSRVSVLLKSNK